MNRRNPGLGRLFGIFLLLIMAVSCGRDDHPDLPDVPEFEALGFNNALGAVRRQVLGVYESWQKAPLDADRNGQLGMHILIYGKNASAEILFRRARVLAPDEFRWAYYLAVSVAEQGRFDEAAGMFREVLRISPGHASSRLLLAKFLLESGDTGESHKLYQSFTDDFPERVEGWFGLGKTLSRIGDNEAAAAALRRALALGPQYGEIHYALAFVLRALGDKDAAADELAAYERTAHNNIRTADPLLRAISLLYAGDQNHMARASNYYGRRDFKSAAESFRAALAINPANMDAWPGLVSAQAKLGEIDAAGDTYREALAAGISYARLHMTYGKALLEVHQLEAARDAIGQAILLDPQSAEALSVMGEIEMQRGASLAAIENFRLALLAGPNDRNVQLSLAQALNEAGQFDEAADILEPLSTDPEVEKSLLLKELALAYRGMNRKDEALEALQRGWEAVLKTNNLPLEHTIKRLLAEWQKDSAE